MNRALRPVTRVVLMSAFAAPQAARAETLGEVTALGRPRDRLHGSKDDGVAATVLERDELVRPGLRVAEALRGQVGLQVAESGGLGAPATASIRGATAAQTPVYLAGIRINDDVAGAADLSRVPAFVLERAEVYRGNAPIEADRLGIGGAIFFEPRTPKKTGAHVGGTLGSFGTRAGSGGIGLREKNWVVLAAVQAEHADNDYPFEDDRGTLLVPTETTERHLVNADVSTYDVWLTGQAWTNAGGSVDFVLHGMTREQGIPTLALVPSRAARGRFDRWLGGTRARLPLGEDRRVELELQSSGSHTEAEYDDPLLELSLTTARMGLTGTRASNRAALRVEAMRTLELRGSIDVATESLGRNELQNEGAGGGNRAALRARRLDSRAALSVRQALGKEISVRALGSVQCFGTSTGAPSFCDDAPFAGRVGVVWQRRAWDAFVVGGHYARVPTLGELYGIAPLVRGNERLTSEVGDSAELGVRLHGRHGYAGATGFARWASNLVSFVRTAQGFVVPTNLAAARVVGAELDAGARFDPLCLGATLTWTDPRDITPGRTLTNDLLPFQSRLVVTARARLVWQKPLSWISTAGFEARFARQSSRFADPAGLAVIAPQLWVDLEAQASFCDDHIGFRVRLTDLFDAPRYDVVGFPLPRRALYASLEATL